jgi:hypothetical protein
MDLILSSFHFQGSGVLADIGAVGAVAATALGAVAIVLAGASLIAGTIRLVQTGKDIREGNKSELATEFRGKAVQLDKEMQKVAKTCENIRGEVDESMEGVTKGIESYEDLPSENLS